MFFDVEVLGGLVREFRERWEGVCGVLADVVGKMVVVDQGGRVDSFGVVGL
jgi:hypothetical protein